MPALKKNMFHTGGRLTSAVHTHKHFAATVYMFSDTGKILLIKHPKLGTWQPPGGHLNENETPTECAVREVKEEVGHDLVFPEEDIKGATLIKAPDYILLEDLSDHNHIDLIYVVKVREFKPKLEKDISGFVWAGPEELDRFRMMENCRLLIKKIWSKQF